MATKLPFRTAYSGQERHTTEPGNRMQDEFGYEIDNYGRKVLVKTGETDLFAKIQEDLEECKIENILKRVVIGDSSMIRPDAVYADISEMPGSLLEARQMMQKLENEWNKLDNEIKKKYNYDLDQYIASAGSDEWLEDMGLIEKKSEPIPTPEPTPEPVKEEKKDE